MKVATLPENGEHECLSGIKPIEEFIVLMHAQYCGYIIW